MVSFVVVTRAALLIARRASTWTIEEHLGERSPECVVVDLSSPTQMYCGTARAGLFRSRNSGRIWEPVGPTALNRREIDLAGDLRTMPEAAQILTKALGRPIAFMQTPIEPVRQYSKEMALMLEWFERLQR